MTTPTNELVTAETWRDDLPLSDTCYLAVRKEQAALVIRRIQANCFRAAASEVDKEPELPGEMPEEVYARLHNKVSAAIVFRANVVATKQSIKRALLAKASELEKGNNK